MVNRIQIILKKKGLSPSQLADEIQVQRSSISHILSGRNKPSLDFVSKVLERFHDLSAEWLIFGKGSMLKFEAESKKEEKGVITNKKEIDAIKDKPENISTSPIVENLRSEKNHDSNEIEKIVIFYKNSTFKEYKSK